LGVLAAVGFFGLAWGFFFNVGPFPDIAVDEKMRLGAKLVLTSTLRCD
jgi:hypothetical protein